MKQNERKRKVIWGVGINGENKADFQRKKKKDVLERNEISITGRKAVLIKRLLTLGENHAQLSE